MGAIHLEGLLPGPGSLLGLVGVSSSETEPGFRTVDWATGLLASSHALSSGSEGPSLPSPPTSPMREAGAPLPTSQPQLGGHHAHSARLHRLSPQAKASAPDVLPLCLHCQGGAHRGP